MQLAIDVAGFDAGRGRSAAPGDGLEAVRRRGWSEIKHRLYAGMAGTRHHR